MVSAFTFSVYNIWRKFFFSHIEGLESYIFCFVREKVYVRSLQFRVIIQALYINSFISHVGLHSVLCLWHLQIFVLLLLFFIYPPNFWKVLLYSVPADFIVFPIHGTRSGSNWIPYDALIDSSRIRLEEWRQSQDLHQHKWKLHSPAEVVALPLWSWLLEEEVFSAALDCRRAMSDNQLLNQNNLGSEGSLVII